MNSKSKVTTNSFIDKANKYYHFKYDYSESEYFNHKTKIKIYCPEHNVYFERIPHKHLAGQCCPICKKEQKNYTHLKYTNETFINKAIYKHGMYTYDYSLVEYINCNTIIKIKCNKCERIFYQKPVNHLQGNGCNLCNNKKRALLQLDNKESFINKAIIKYGDKAFNYDYIVYEKSKIKVLIKCNKCKNKFEQRPNDHLLGNGCPDCNLYGNVSEPKLLKKIILEFKNYEIITKGKPKWLGRQHLDIYFPDLNIAIEYQGKQHFEPIDFFGGNNSFMYIQKMDEQKRKLCLQNNCKLFYFTYTKKDVPENYPYKVYTDECELIEAIKVEINYK